MKPVDRFLYWIRERHNIYVKRKQGKPAPWTDDQVLRDYFFTNPYRENDKVTVWFRKNVRDPLKHDPEVLFATVCFRWFNWIPTGEILLRENLLVDWNAKRAVKVLTGLEQVFTGAFMITAGGSEKKKVPRVCEDYIQPVWDDLCAGKLLRNGVCKWTTMEACHKRLKRYMGMGGSGFMSYEVVCDLRYTDLLKNATDKLVWSNPGPGARRGVNRILERPLAEQVTDWLYQSHKLLELVQKELADMPPFEMREIEHSLCEFDKYERARLGEGKLKRRYPQCR